MLHGALPPKMFCSIQLMVPPISAPNLWIAAPKLRLLSSSSNSQLALNFSGSAVSTRSEEHTSELQSLMRISYAVFCLKKKKKKKIEQRHYQRNKKQQNL